MLLCRFWLQYPNLHVFVDGNYDGPFIGWAKTCCNYRLQVVVKPPQQKGFSPLPRHWVVERTFAWLGQWRRLAKDYEQAPQSEESFIHMAMMGIMLNRLVT